MVASREQDFKLHWEKSSQFETEEEIVFGSFLGKQWSRSLDNSTFSSLEKLLEMRSEKDFIIDIGCGPLARAEVQYSLKGYRIIGYDISITTLGKTRKNVEKYGISENVYYIAGDAEYLPFRDNIFTKTICIGTLSHLPNLKCVINTLRQIKRISKLNGLMYITFWLNKYSLMGLQQIITLRLYDLLRKDRANYLFFNGIKDLNNIFNKCKIKIKKIRYGNLVNMPFILFVLPHSIQIQILRIINIINLAHKRNFLFANYSSVFEVLAENSKFSKDQFVSAKEFNQFF